jgi:hypothetical protein
VRIPFDQQDGRDVLGLKFRKRRSKQAVFEPCGGKRIGFSNIIFSLSILMLPVAEFPLTAIAVLRAGLSERAKKPYPNGRSRSASNNFMATSS